MHNFKGLPWQHFMEFISPNADRFALLAALLAKVELEYNVVEFSGYRHIIVNPLLPDQPGRSPTLIVAHYDRAEGSPGANDNSVGVFILIETALKLKKKSISDWRMIFTDGEELKSGESIRAQGSYALAEGFKNSKLEKSPIFCIDTCGRGDTLVISTTLEHLLKKDEGGGRLKESVIELRNIALDIARNMPMLKVLLAPTPFSDDAGFFRAGLAAQTITMLPSDECISLVSELRKDQNFADVLISAQQKKGIRMQSIPETWRSLNSAVDSHLRLTPKNFKSVVNFVEALCSR